VPISVFDRSYGKTDDGPRRVAIEDPEISDVAVSREKS
jgi:hypothetical protein